MFTLNSFFISCSRKIKVFIRIFRNKQVFFGLRRTASTNLQSRKVRWSPTLALLHTKELNKTGEVYLL